MLDSMEKIVNLCKARGYIYPGSEIYGGLANTWDYGPLGVELKNNVKSAWRKKFIQEQPNIVGLDAAILMNPETWVASGHVGGFSDPLIDCKECKTRHRADKLIEEWATQNGQDLVADGWSDEEMIKFMDDHIRELLRAKKEGANIKGYYVWSSMDLYSWINGTVKRYGLVYVDFDKDLKRYPKQSYYWYRDFIKKYQDENE